jgi:hypothetical protein
MTGTYKSTCILQLRPEVVLALNPDSSFSYQFAYLDKQITGSWVLNKDTIFLFSEYFDSKYNRPLTPKYKY